MSEFALDVDATNFEAVVIDGSMHAPVVVDFWAEWCGPCQTLKPVLEKLAQEYQGRFTLAKVNADRNPALASQFGVRGIPAVKAVYRGEIVDEFSGALPESAVREFIDRVIPSPATERRLAAAAQRDAGDLDGALETLRQAAQMDPQDEEVRLDSAAILVQQNRLDAARPLLDSLSPALRSQDRAARLLARLDFSQVGEAGSDEATLRANLANRPEDMDSRLKLANLLIAAGRHAQGMDELLELVRRDRDWNGAAARRTLLKVFDLLGDDPLVGHYRRKLASVLH